VVYARETEYMSLLHKGILPVLRHQMCRPKPKRMDATQIVHAHAALGGRSCRIAGAPGEAHTVA
jgi:hypothetical protein